MRGHFPPAKSYLHRPVRRRHSKKRARPSRFDVSGTTNRILIILEYFTAIGSHMTLLLMARQRQRPLDVKTCAHSGTGTFLRILLREHDTHSVTYTLLGKARDF
jgi:hypothetical protein